MQLHGTHKISLETIRTLAINCHALDLAGFHLFVDGTHTDMDGRTQSAYEELLTSQLLGLAVALRTKFYQGVDFKNTNCYVSASALLYKIENGVEQSVSFTIKDICDKIIHATTFKRDLEPGIEKPTTTITGSRGNEKWELGISISLFSEGVLNWLQTVQSC